MQKSTHISEETHNSLPLDDISLFLFDLHPGDRLFFIGDLGSGKSTLIRLLLQKHFSNQSLIVRSPTYTYYTKYDNVYHFDLYRVESQEDLTLLGIDDILSDPTTICLIEWPEILGPSYTPTKVIQIESVDTGSRDYTIETRDLTPSQRGSIVGKQNNGLTGEE